MTAHHDAHSVGDTRGGALDGSTTTSTSMLGQLRRRVVRRIGSLVESPEQRETWRRYFSNYSRTGRVGAPSVDPAVLRRGMATLGASLSDLEWSVCLQVADKHGSGAVEPDAFAESIGREIQLTAKVTILGWSGGVMESHRQGY